MGIGVELATTGLRDRGQPVEVRCIVYGADQVQRDPGRLLPLRQRNAIQPVEQRQQPCRLLGMPRAGIMGETGGVGENGD